MLRRLVILLVVAVYTDAADVVRCFACTDIHHPGDCDTVTSCTIGQICVVEQYITSGGLTLYNTGCQSKQRCAGSHKRDIPEYSSLSKRANIITCDECCDGEFCNNKGCGNIAPAHGAVTCFACDVESSPTSCIHIKTCDTELVCMLTELKKIGPSGETLYKSGCISPKVCQTYALLGRKRYNFCHVCCNDDYCNDHCDALVTRAPTTSTLTSTTTTSTRTTTTTITPKLTMTSTTTSITTTTTPKPTETTNTTTTIQTPSPSTTTQTTTTPKPTTTSTTTTQTPSPTTTTTQTTTTSQLNLHDVCHHHDYHFDAHSNLCYKLHHEDKTWNEANKMCIHEGGTLAIINTQSKWDVLKQALQHDPRFKHSHRIYIGGRNTHDDVYQWVGGETVVFADWGLHQPRRQPNSCIFINENQHYEWYSTIECGDDHRFVCTIQL